MKKLNVLILFFFLGISVYSQVEKRKVIVDADTGNEVDDLYAISRALIEPGWDVVGLNATQWQASHWAVEKSMEESFRLNEVLLAYLNTGSKTKSNKGAINRLFDWGNKSQPSAASNFIISEAKKVKSDKLTIIALGALTNVASAILDAPYITDKLEVYWLGTSFDFEKNAMKTTDFNCVMDIQAVDVILNSKVDLHIIPVNTASKLIFSWKETNNRLKGKHDLLDFLLNRWYNHHDENRASRTIWDLAIIQAVIFPEYAQQVKIKTSIERGGREIWMYSDIDAGKMREEFFTSLLSHFNSKKNN